MKFLYFKQYIAITIDNGRQITLIGHKHLKKITPGMLGNCLIENLILTRWSTSAFWSGIDRVS